jgi:hypothetical protein
MHLLWRHAAATPPRRASRAQAAMAESGRSEEQRRALREALKRRLADMAALQAAAEGERREQAELLAKIKAMEGKVGLPAA